MCKSTLQGAASECLDARRGRVNPEIGQGSTCVLCYANHIVPGLIR